MATFKGILTFPTLFVAETPKGSTEPKFSAGMLFPANDPQVPIITKMVEDAKLATFPSGYTGADECFGVYEQKITPDKGYYDPRFNGWYLLTTTAKETDRPPVVDGGLKPVMDKNDVCAGAVVYMNCGISGYVKGKGGIGGWLNGIMTTGEAMPFGRLDGKPSVEQMFADVGGNPATGGAAQSTPQTTQAPPPPPPTPDTPPPPPPPAHLIATEKAGGATVDQMLAWQGWTEESLLANGYIIKPQFA